MTRPSLTERAAAYLVQREVARQLDATDRGADLTAHAGGGQFPDTRWRGASRSLRSMVSWVVRGGAAHQDLPIRERQTMIARSYDAHRNHMLARAVISRARTNIVGTGLIPHATVDAEVLGISSDEAEELDALIDSEFASWSDTPVECDAEGTLDFTGLQAMALVSSMLAGDSFAATPWVERPGGLWGLKVQMIDGERVTNPHNAPDTDRLIDGVEMDALGFPLFYHTRRRHPLDILDPIGANTWDALRVWGAQTGRRRVMHVWNDKDRIGAVRGAPFLAPILEPLQQLETYSRAELMAAVVSSLLTVFLTREREQLDDQDRPLAAIAGEEEGDLEAQGEERHGRIEMGSGAMIDLEPGTKPEMVNPSRPNSNYDPYFLSVVTQIGAALEMPRDEVLLMYQQSYSAARAAMLQAYRWYTMRRWFLVQQFGAPIRLLWFDEAVAKGRLPVTGYGDPRRRAAYTAAMWIGPARGSMDEVKEAQAAERRIQAGVSNETIETAAMMGESWRHVHATRLREQRIRVRDRVSRNGDARANGGGTAAPPNDPPPAPPASSSTEE